MKISARNQIKGKVIEAKKGQTTAHVRIDIGNGVIVTASITNDAVDISPSSQETMSSPSSRRLT